MFYGESVPGDYISGVVVIWAPLVPLETVNLVAWVTVTDSIYDADHEGSPRVNGDEEEEDTDDLENEFSYTDFDKQDKHEVTEEMLHTHMGYGHDSDLMMSPIRPQYPLLTNGHMVDSTLHACNFCLLWYFSVKSLDVIYRVFRMS